MELNYRFCLIKICQQQFYAHKFIIRKSNILIENQNINMSAEIDFDNVEIVNVSDVVVEDDNVDKVSIENDTTLAIVSVKCQ